MHIIYKHIRLKAVVSQWHSRSFGVGNETAQVRILVCFFFFFFFFSSSPSSFYLCMCGNGEGFVHFLHINAKSLAFPK